MDTKALRQKILDLAIHGKLVPQDPNDEPASVLLERIRAEKERLIKEGKIKKGKKSAKTSDKPHYPFELPKGWVWTTVGEITNYGDSVNVQVEDIDNSDWVLELEDIEKDTAKIIQHLNKNERKINGTRHKFQKGQILYSKLRTYLNKVLVAPNDGFCTTEIMAFGSYGILSNNYICYVLRSLYFLDYTLQCGYGVKMPRLSTTDACNGLIPLPPLAEQERIVNEIQRLFSIIDIVENGKDGLQTAIQQAKNKILDHAIHGKLVPQDPNDEPASELLKRINPKAEIITDNGHYQKLPVGWTICRLKDISKIVTGSTPSKSNCGYYGGIFPFFKPADLDAGRHVYKAAEYLSEDGKRASRVVPKGTTAICCIGTIGKVGYLMYEGATNQQINCAIPSKVVDSVFLFYLCASPLFNDKLNSESSAVTISIVNKSKIEAISVPLPPLAEQKRIVSKIEDIFAQLETIETAL